MNNKSKESAKYQLFSQLTWGKYYEISFSNIYWNTGAIEFYSDLEGIDQIPITNWTCGFRVLKNLN